MFETGNLLFFRPFIFKNGAEPQDKFMVVLGLDTNGNMVLASLPTSKNHVPSDIDVESGCIVEPNGMRQTAFAFDVNTFIYGSDLDTYPISTFQQQISCGETNVTLIGKLSDKLLVSLIDCLKKSKMVKNKFKRLIVS